ncbi:MAG: SpoIIE family protein phosphatase [Bacteroidetes bacterium]|jgi:serine phosphatase RsbU (regulator of sigma subunit)/HAMP domain-containing protein|nr:SpoIIE family protein phosphatase [Bacteroidota bacterium]
MKFRFTIGRKILLGFGALIFLVLLAFSLTLVTIRKSGEINDKIANLYTPSVDKLQEMRLMITRSKMYLTNWVNIQTSSQDKDKLKRLIDEEYPNMKKDIQTLSKGWSQKDSALIKYIFISCDSLWIMHHQVMNDLNSFDSYDDPSIVFLTKPRVLDEDGDITVQTRNISDLLDHLIRRQYDAASAKRTEMLESFQTLSFVVMLLLIVLPLGGILIAFLTTRSITKPVSFLKGILLSMARGILPHEKIKKRNDEIGEMSVALNSLVDSMKLTTEFAREVGAGNFDSYYKPLSEEDSLGDALLKMREDLRENERVLEAKVIERTEEVVRQKEEIEIQNQKLEIVYKHITDSIRYAKRLQDAILPPSVFVNRLLPESFILFKPKDIVSGDFYWMYEKENRVFVSAVDCTGHGVPGAFMSIVGNNMLNQIVKERPGLNAGQMLDELNILAGKTINQHSEEGAVRDGMDMTLCIFDPITRMMDMAGANNSLYLFRQGELKEYKADKIPIGYVEGNSRSFTNHSIQLEVGDTIYLFSDGYADQFGGPKGKKFMVGQFRTFLNQIHKLPLAEQMQTLDSTIEHWRGNLEQVDDILVIGFRVN